MTTIAFTDPLAAQTIQATPGRVLSLTGAPAQARMMLMALLGLEHGALVVHTPDGQVLRFGRPHGPAADLIVRDYAFAQRVAKGGDIGFADGWIEEEWTSTDLAALLTLLSANAERLMRYFRGGLVTRMFARRAHQQRDNTREGARRNILAHYDLGNSFFETWLDASMTYSAARFDKAADLETAQQRKYAALAHRLCLKPGDSVLEIGCGWGGFAEYAARNHGARVTAITISDEQFAYAKARMAKAGLTQLVEIRRQDYRDVEGRFDGVASIEMIEAVGEAYWPDYFRKVADVLKPGARAAIQAITIRDELFARYRARADFIQHYIFPGGMLPSARQLRAHSAAAGLEWRGSEAFGSCYAATLAEWTRRFQSRWESMRQQGFDERFKRLWLFYLGYCEAGFHTGRTDVVQFTLEKS